jgi:hypothetical protein
MARRAPIRVGDTFTVRTDGVTNTFRRETDDPKPRFECERIRITHVSCSVAPTQLPYTFGTEPAWFTERGLTVEI